jgi:hypothetical protein
MSTLVAQTISNGTVSTSSANVIQGSARAWVSFNAQTSSIRSSFNVASITNYATGHWGVNFTNVMPDTNYCAISNANGGGTSASTSTSGGSMLSSSTFPTATSNVRVMSFPNDASGTLVNCPFTYVAVFSS